MSAGPRILVVGCGGIGGVVSAALAYQGLDVTPLTRNASIAEAINTLGFRTQGELNLGTVQGRAVTKIPKGAKPFDYILLATQPPQVEEAARSTLDHLAADGAMVVFQNGLCEERIAPIAGPGRVIGAIVAWGASMVEPGVYDRTSAGGFTLGNKDGSHDERLRNLALLLEAIGPVTLTDNLMGARWSKLAINCAISSIGTVGGDRLGALLRKRYVRRLALEVMTETVEVARMDAIRLEKVSGTLDLEWIALTEAERTQAVGSPSLFAKHTLLLAVGTRYRRLRSSMLNAIERGRPVAVDFLNGEVVERGKRYGIATPINAALLEEVKRIAAGNSRAAHETLAALYRRTREALAPPTVDAAVSASAPASTAASIAGVESAAPPSSGIPPTLQQDTVELPADAHPQIRDETIELPRE